MRVPIRKSEKFTYIKKDPNMTKEKLDQIKAYLEKMLKARPSLAKDVQIYGANGDFSENAEYQIAKSRLRSLNRKIDEAKEIIAKAVVIEIKKNCESIEIGCRVVLRFGKDIKEYLILGSSETNPEKGIISSSSPLGEALLGRKKGDKFLFETKFKKTDCEVLEIG